MDILEILKSDYERFPDAQTYSIYDPNVYFKDPLNEFHGIKRYRQMIGLINTWFSDIKLELHAISRTDNTISTRWTLGMTPPLPWKPRLAIPGRSQLKLNTNGQIIAHLDYWDISRLDVLRQNFFTPF
ncbi:MAG: DUF2358 domain-containing protein [Chloroflexaceae bacterium]|nr:DUF2358 domain-containing protein [Chloroflexaceae bacterium]